MCVLDAAGVVAREAKVASEPDALVGCRGVPADRGQRADLLPLAQGIWRAEDRPGAPLTQDIVALAKQYGRLHGCRRVAALLRHAGWTVNRKRARHASGARKG